LWKRGVSMQGSVRTVAVGRITLAATFIALGLVFLIENLATINLIYPLRVFWPAVILLFGLEILVRQYQADRAPYRVRIYIDAVAVIVLFLVVITLALGSFPFLPRRGPFWGRWIG